jgi:hypothetical protein
MRLLKKKRQNKSRVAAATKPLVSWNPRQMVAGINSPKNLCPVSRNDTGAKVV